MNHDQAERLLSARIDGERLSARADNALDHHLGTCAGCRAFERGAYRLREAARFEVAPAVPDLVGEVMSVVGAEAGRPRPRSRVVRPAGPPGRGLAPRLAPIAAALLVGALVGSLVVGGPWQRPDAGSALAATEITRGIAAAAVRLDAYQATFAITELHLSPQVPQRELTMGVWFETPERFRLDVVDHTDYPTRTTPTDLRLVVDGSTWYAAGPAPCPTATCPQHESVVRNRLPFSTAAPIPTDLVLPISTLADADRLTVLGRGTVLGRPAIRVEVPFERAEPLFPFLSIGGDWRPFFPNDRVRIWLDERSWFPLRWSVYPATGAERDAWALRFGLPEEPALRPVFSVTALDVSLDEPDAAVFDIPATTSSRDQGARPVALADVRRATGFEPVAPRVMGGLDRYRVVLTRDDAGGTLVAYAAGLAYLNLGETQTWNGDAPFGPVGVQAEEIPLAGGGVAYYEPSSDGHGRRVSIHAAGTDLYLESNLPRPELLAAAAALPVRGLPMPEAWRLRESGAATVERVSLARARASVPFPIELPTALPDGFSLASVELVDAGYGVGATLYLRDRDADAGIGTIRLHLEPATELPPATSARQSAVDVAGVQGRFTPDRSQLEWIAGGVYRSLDAPGLELEELLGIATSIGRDGANR
ncbi:MAG TPA: zf-HC2 domain-containing protein [Actinomycetota bacterium]|nr:zf-HC2 domain-containing protein [Actinomycetota bacterium]